MMCNKSFSEPKSTKQKSAASLLMLFRVNDQARKRATPTY